MDDGHPIIRIVIFIILLLIDAAFTGTEVAVSAVNESVLTKKKEEGDSRAPGFAFCRTACCLYEHH